jgi:hypothetical protein
MGIALFILKTAISKSKAAWECFMSYVSDAARWYLKCLCHKTSCLSFRIWDVLDLSFGNMLFGLQGVAAGLIEFVHIISCLSNTC